MAFVDTSLILTDQHNRPLQADFHIRRTEPNNEANGATNSQDGFASFWLKADEEGLPPAVLTVTKSGYKPLVTPIPVPPQQSAPLRFILEQVVAPRPSRQQMLAVAANFCNVSDSDNLPIFSCFLPHAVEVGKYDDWMRCLIEAGSTHVVFSPFATYGTYMSPFNWLDQPERFAELVLKVSETVGRNGMGLTPILFLDDGSRDPIKRIDTYWPALANAMRRNGTIGRCIIVPAWEPVKGDWRSSEMSYALKKCHELFPESLLGWHGSQARWVGSSNPVEADDPWQGGESDFYKSHGGEFIDIVLYQAQGDSPVRPFCDIANPECWLSRWDDGVVRVGGGLNGWRIIPLCLAEGPAYLYIRGVITSDDARRWATAGKRQALSRGVGVSFMNGLPYDE